MLFAKANLSAYSSEPFAAFMDSAREEDVYLAGYNAQMCCLSTMVEGHHRGHRFNYIADASCARATSHASEQEAHRHACDIISIYAKLVSTNEIMKAQAAA